LKNETIKQYNPISSIKIFLEHEFRKRMKSHHFTSISRANL
jgi:hypothetical protein